MMYTYRTGTEEELVEGGGQVWHSYLKAKEYADEHNLCIVEDGWNFDYTEMVYSPDWDALQHKGDNNE